MLAVVDAPRRVRWTDEHRGCTGYPSAVTAWGSGDVFAGYVIERHLGPGRFGEVYVARHPRVPRRDLLEVLPVIAPTETAFRQRFAADIAELSRSVRVHDHGEIDGRLWVATEFVEPVPPQAAPVVPRPSAGIAPRRPWWLTAAAATVVAASLLALVSLLLPASVDDVRVRSAGWFDQVWQSISIIAVLVALVLVLLAGFPAFVCLVARRSPGLPATVGSAVITIGVLSVIGAAMVVDAGYGSVYAPDVTRPSSMSSEYVSYPRWAGPGAWLLLGVAVVSVIAGVVLKVGGTRWQRRVAPAVLDSAPSATAVVSASHAPGRQGVTLTAKYFPLAWMLAFTKPVIEVDGRAVPGRWGAMEIPLPPGEHRVHVHVPYLGAWRIGAVDGVVPVHPGQETRVEYVAPAWAFSKGALGPAPQRYPGLGITIGVVAVPVVLAVLVLPFMM